ncbi:MHYT domain-containing protein [Gilvimarinus xylanilyticus]|uniref:Diguanylate cyclase n=1 Tax=Gilvimarinus xylanilyticus TaxID=2944139 RepID=A0A9X2I0B3_9GAMM|nr:MHYT domain-containing protein [Gilvimarinus xylanilyticus]MCP8897861.1 diguanylate cyclase [Gilvimarinus xylanilyticus]
MTGSYNLTLVFASYCVAVIAAYTAIYFGTRLFTITGPARRFWLWIGAVCLGTGIWSMHFVGMSAYTMPMDMEMSFSLPLTIASWIPAVLASALALTVITRPQASVKSVVSSAIIMGAGISAMHYGGMYAMQMQPQIQYDSLIVAISVLIAVVASGAALVICRQVRVVPAKYALATKTAAALVMGAAICGMHYTGMAAASYPMGAEMATENSLRGQWMGIPTAIVASLFLLVALVVAYQDFRQAEKERREEKQRTQQIHSAAFTDSVTGLSNRSAFEQALMRRIAGAGQKGFSLLYLDLGQYRELQNTEGESASDEFARGVANMLQTRVQGIDVLVRYSSSGFMVLLNGRQQDAQVKALALAIKADIQSLPFAAQYGQWTLGCSHYPDSASNSRLLVREAQRGRFGSTTSGAPEPVAA